MVAPRPRLVLFDFDGVLARYSHADRVAHLASTTGCPAATVTAVLFDSGLETAYDSGALTTEACLARLGDGLGCRVDEETWIAARVAGNRVDPAVLALASEVASQVPIGVLTNNGALMAEAIRELVAPLFPALEGRVLCSGALGVRKPDPAIFARALEHFGMPAADTLFIDDLFANVRAARAVGLRAETARNARTLRKALSRNGLGDQRT